MVAADPEGVAISDHRGEAVEVGDERAVGLHQAFVKRGHQSGSASMR